MDCCLTEASHYLTNVGFASMRFYRIHIRAISQWAHKLFCIMVLNIILCELLLHIRWAMRLNLLMTYITEHVRGKYGKDTPITIIYEDRPTADFNSVFRALSGLFMHAKLINLLALFRTAELKFDSYEISHHRLIWYSHEIPFEIVYKLSYEIIHLSLDLMSKATQGCSFEIAYGLSHERSFSLLLEYSINSLTIICPVESL